MFKLKVCTEREADVTRVKLIRETIGYDVQLRLDSNEAWTSKEALKKIADFEPYKPAHTEQPVPHWDLNGLRTVCENSAVPIVIDESVLTLKYAFRVVAHVGGDILNIKTARSGGLFPSLKMAAVAESTGVVPLLGNMHELGIGTVANCHFCAALTGSNLGSELIGPQFVKKDILKKDLEYRDGNLILPEGPGWGVELDEHAVRDFTVR